MNHAQAEVAGQLLYITLFADFCTVLIHYRDWFSSSLLRETHCLSWSTLKNLYNCLEILKVREF